MIPTNKPQHMPLPGGAAASDAPAHTPPDQPASHDQHAPAHVVRPN